jgi:protein subunit release factor A
MEKVTLELRAAEGGEDSKLLIGDMAAVYLKAAKINGFKIESEY